MRAADRLAAVAFLVAGLTACSESGPTAASPTAGGTPPVVALHGSGLTGYLTASANGGAPPAG